MFLKTMAFFFLFGTLQAAELNIIEKKIQVNGKEAAIFAIQQPDGTPTVQFSKGQDFDVDLKNSLSVPTSVHWHGIILPNDQDGVAFITQYPIYPGLSYKYKFPLVQSGTHWMHAHYGLQEQNQLSAPLIIYDIDDHKIADQEVIVFLSDFSFKSPMEIYANLRCKNRNMKMDHGGMKMNSPDLVDVDYDALLTNNRTLENPEIVEVKPGEKIRLRIINGSSATNFFINMDQIASQAIAVDGNRIKPFQSSQYELAVAQRIDLIVEIPQSGGSFPIITQGEGTDLLTGLVLHTKNAEIPKLSSKATKKTGAFTNIQEGKLEALNPLPEKPVDKQLIVGLEGNMADYTWTMNNQAWPESTPLIVEKGQRVEIIFKNKTMMSHPMHLHGHVFQVTALDGKPLAGALRDTILVMPNSTASIQFDADNPGVWPLHCHILYHMEAGMFTVLRYKDYIQPLIK